jgi:aminoglycoside phosphotransferase (APT) family kinase protein
VALRGGYDTQVFAFRLSGISGVWARPLILRLLGPQHDPRRAIREQVIQNTVAGLGYPAPRVLSASADPRALGGGFLVMERVAGRPLLAERWFGVASVLVESHRRLHSLDATPLLEALRGEAGRDAVTFDGLLTQLQDRVTRRSLDGLRLAMDWLTALRPATDERPVICHGDFHPQNILVSRGTVTGVLDWPNVVVADAAYDVASTRLILGLVPVQLIGVPAPLRAPAGLARRWMLRRYVSRYRRHRAIDPIALAYYEAAACMRQLLRVSECRLAAAAGEATLTALDASSFGERVCARFTRLTGIAPQVPSAGLQVRPAG